MFLYNFFRIILEIKKSEYPGGYSMVRAAGVEPAHHEGNGT